MRSLSQPGKRHPFPSAPRPFSGFMGMAGTQPFLGPLVWWGLGAPEVVSGLYLPASFPPHCLTLSQETSSKPSHLVYSYSDCFSFISPFTLPPSKTGAACD